MLAPLSRDWIAQHIPHQGSMCLIDVVLAWDDASVHCRSTTHLLADNPLRAEGRLGMLCGVEYAAQCIAVHCVLASPPSGHSGPLAPGYIVALHDIECHADRLDAGTEPLDMVAIRQAVVPGGAVYVFTIHCAERLLQSGRITLKLPIQALNIKV